jgi:hypothetical protein
VSGEAKQGIEVATILDTEIDVADAGTEAAAAAGEVSAASVLSILSASPFPRQISCLPFGWIWRAPSTEARQADMGNEVSAPRVGIQPFPLYE